MDEPTTETLARLLENPPGPFEAPTWEQDQLMQELQPDLNVAAARLRALQARVEELERERAELHRYADELESQRNALRSQLADAREALEEYAYGFEDGGKLARAALDKGDGDG